MLKPAATGPHGTQPRPRPLLRTTLGGVLRRTRRAQGRTLADVARAAQVSMPYLSEVERGRKEASSEVLAAICDALRIELPDLLAVVGHDLAQARRARAAGRARARRAAGRETAGRAVPVRELSAGPDLAGPAEAGTFAAPADADADRADLGGHAANVADRDLDAPASAIGEDNAPTAQLLRLTSGAGGPGGPGLPAPGPRGPGAPGDVTCLLAA